MKNKVFLLTSLLVLTSGCNSSIDNSSISNDNNSYDSEEKSSIINDSIFHNSIVERVRIIDDEDVVIHGLTAEIGDDISSKIDFTDKNSGSLNDHPTLLYKIENDNSLVKAESIKNYDGSFSSLDIYTATYNEFLKDDYLYGEYINARGDRLTIDNLEISGVLGEFSFTTSAIHLSNPHTFIIDSFTVKKDNEELDYDVLEKDLTFGAFKIDNNEMKQDVTSLGIGLNFLLMYLSMSEEETDLRMVDFYYYKDNIKAVDFN